MPQLLHLRALHHRAQLGLADQEALQQRMIAELEIREHAQLLDRPAGEVLRLVDDQQRALVFHRDLAQERLERAQQHRFADRAYRKTESDPDRAKNVVGVEMRADELCRHDLLAVELLQKTANDRRLAGADLAGNDDEALALIQPVLKISECALVPAAAEKERRIGIQLKRLTRQLVERLVHVQSVEYVSQADEDARTRYSSS